MKGKIGKIIIKSKHSPFSNVLIKANLVIYHWDNKMRMTHPGKGDPDKIYYVIRPRGITEGLLSSWFAVLEQVNYAFDKGYVPFVDFTEENKGYCQYYVDREIEGTVNAWEYFFKQPSTVRKEDLINKKNVLLNGWTWRNSKTNDRNRKCEQSYKNAQLISVRDYIKDKVVQKAKECFEGHIVMAVFIRGTDYVSIKPTGHPVQPNIDEMIQKVKETLCDHPSNLIYLVTEDKSYEDRFKAEFPGMITSIYDTNIEYKQGELIQKAFNDDPYERGLQYLIRVLMMNYCDYLVSSVASGSLFARAIRPKDPKYEYWFELGDY